MKRKIFSIVFALTLVLSFSLVMAAPAGAATDRLSMVTHPTSTTAGETINGPPAVRALTAGGNPVAGVEVTVSEIGYSYPFDAGTLMQTTNGARHRHLW